MKISIFGVRSTIQILLFTALKGKPVGTDSPGNKYYKCAPRKGTELERRWVMYVDKAEASLVPPEWHGWLHHQTDILPGNSGGRSPPGGARREVKRATASGDYISWQPPQ
ncbi:MAG: NADH-ubiquinone oxidoreductase subunit NDUFA12 family protein [Pseudomonadota bacterium]